MTRSCPGRERVAAPAVHVSQPVQHHASAPGGIAMKIAESIAHPLSVALVQGRWTTNVLRREAGGRRDFRSSSACSKPMAGTGLCSGEHAESKSMIDDRFERSATITAFGSSSGVTLDQCGGWRIGRVDTALNVAIDHRHP
jgi:hypothetical protein